MTLTVRETGQQKREQRKIVITGMERESHKYVVKHNSVRMGVSKAKWSRIDKHSHPVQ